MKTLLTIFIALCLIATSCDHKHEGNAEHHGDHDHPHQESHEHDDDSDHSHSHDGDHDDDHEHGSSSIDFDEKLKTLNITLTKPSPPVANYVNITQAGKILFLAGKGPNKPEGGYVTGKVGQDLTVEEGYAAAQLVGIAQLSVLKDHLGDLNKVKRILKVKGMVNSTSDFTNHPEVINGYSDMMVAVFGEKGKHARAAVGMGSLPRNIAVEVEMVVEIY